MKKRFTEEQKAFALRQADSGVPIGEILRKLGISEATFYNWRKKYNGLTPSEMKRLRQLKGKHPSEAALEVRDCHDYRRYGHHIACQ